MAGGLINDENMGDVWPVVHPGRAADEYGSASISPPGPFEVRSFQTIVLTYTVGRFGLDDSGSIKIVQRFPNDGGRLQVDDPTAMNFVSARASKYCRLTVVPERNGHQRPWERSLRIIVGGGSLHQGDTITVTFGDRSGSSPGLQLQTFCESAHEFRVLADPCATGHFIPLPDRPHVAIVAGKPERWKAILPTHGKPGASFALGLKAEDLWGNPSHQAGRALRLEADGTVQGLPGRIDFPAGERSLRIDGLVACSEGVVRIRVLDADGILLTASNPLVVRIDGATGFWGDLHGQSGETVGVNPIEEYFAFGRDLAFLDIMSHQANDFQITNAFWQRINTLTSELDDPGRFVAFPGYEWSGNTPMGGDHNVFFRKAGETIRRSSHALLVDRSDLDNDANTTTELFESLKNEDCVLYAHVGGRPADIARDDGGTLRTAVEVHSDWGTFEWIMKDSFARGYRLGLVCNSDGHKGRPGASYPGASQFGARGGLTCFLADTLSRDGIFEALRRRHHYGTTGCRMFLDVRVSLPTGGRRFDTDPRYGQSGSQEVNHAVMGDIVQTTDGTCRLNVEVAAHAPILRVDVLNGPDVVDSVRGYSKSELGDRIRVTFHGAEYRGRGRQTTWKGEARFDGAGIERFQRINAWNHDRLLAQHDDNTVAFDVLTTGNFIGFDAWLSNAAGDLTIGTDHAGGRFRLADIGIDETVVEAGGLERQIRIARLPDICRQDHLKHAFDLALKPTGDNPIWIRVTTEDGYNAWSSPIYLFRGDA
ncbi:hypothetical protein BAL199_01174 [alpha proteobacterium BAL199]|nr:hypothetical protein BAL199_01174 [alpha proteobacterium BAL199]